MELLEIKGEFMMDLYIRAMHVLILYTYMCKINLPLARYKLGTRLAC